MENTNKTGPKEFFLHVGTIVLLYSGIVALLTILFTVINVAFPQVDYYYNPSISFPVATLIVVFPLFVYINFILRKSYIIHPELKNYSVRKWLIYITLFVTGAVLSGDLICLLYYFLDGKELTAGFLLKVVSVIVVTGTIFGYYLDDLRDRLTTQRRNLWRIVSITLVAGSIVLGFLVLGSPHGQRLIRYDSEKIMNLQDIQWQIVNFWRSKETLPKNLEELKDPISGRNVPNDPQTNADYVYEVTGNLSFNLCADFNKSSNLSHKPLVNRIFPTQSESLVESWSWEYESGRFCFERTIDPELYPPHKF